jgi:Tfp pilus assembly protein PilV
MLKRGFSLIEVLIFVTILTLFFVAAVGLTSQALQHMKASENRLLATHYNQELLEWARGEKETDWNGRFLPKAPLPLNSGTTYCFNITPITSWPANAAPCGTYALNSSFKRELTLARVAIAGQVGQYQVNATATVTWREGTNIQTVTNKTIFTAFD